MNDNKTAIFRDGYNGHKIECELEPIETLATSVKLRVTGTHLSKWVYTQEWEFAKVEAKKTAPDACTFLGYVDGMAEYEF